MSFEDYENILTTYIQDDDRLVTYKWLSKELEVHVNTAKNILKMYWEKHKNKEELVATFMLIGKLKNGSYQITVVKDVDLEKSKQKFSILTSEHLYSLQKKLDDIELLATAGEGDLRFSMIKVKEQSQRLKYTEKNKPCKVEEKINSNTDSNCIKIKKEDSLKISKTEKIEKSDNSKDDKKSEIKSEDKDLTDSTDNVDKKKSNSESKSAPSGKSTSNSKNTNKSKKPIQSKQSGFNNLFGKVSNTATKTQKTDTSVKETTNKESKKKSEDSGPKKTEEKIVDKKSQEVKDSPKKNQIIDIKESPDKSNQKNNASKDAKESSNKKSQTKEELESPIKSKQNNQKASKKKETKVEKNAKRKKKQNESNDLSKKRRRIVIASDSSEDESKSSGAESEEPMEVEEIPVQAEFKKQPDLPPAEKQVNGKKMVRKLVDKFYKDEDGYLVSKSEWVYEEASDNEIDKPVEIKSVKTENKVTEKKKEVVKKKQSSMMSFLKKI